MRVRARWLVGLFGTRADETNTATLTVVRGTPVSVYRRHDLLTELAAYAEYTYEVTPRLALTAGGRARGTWLSTYADGFDLTPALRDAAAGELKDQGFAPKLRASYTFASGAVVYGQVQEGYRSGGFDVPALPAAAPAPPPTILRYSPDRLLNSEAGRGAAAAGRDTADAARRVFHAQWKKLQSDQYLASGLPMTVNIGDGSNTGLELGVTWRPDDHFQLRATCLLRGPAAHPGRQRLPGDAEHRPAGRALTGWASVDLRYGWSPWQGFRAEISGQYAYVGPSFLTFDRGESNAQGGYGVGRLAANLSSRHWRLEAFVDNVADARGNTFAFGNPFSRDVAPPRRRRLRPRTIGLALGRGF